MHKKKTKKLKDLVIYMEERIEGIQKIPSVMADRALKIGALSFFALFFGVYMGRQTGSGSLILWSVAICLFGLWYSCHLFRLGEKQEYEIVEGTVYELKGRYSIGRVYKVGIRCKDGRLTWLLLDKRYRFRVGRQYRFYFNQKRQNVLVGVKGLDAALNIDSFYGVEELEQGQGE